MTISLRLRHVCVCVGGGGGRRRRRGVRGCLEGRWVGVGYGRVGGRRLSGPRHIVSRD